MINKILVAVDDSKVSEKALDIVIHLAEKILAEILLISVVPYKPIPHFSLPTAPTPSINPNATIAFLEGSKIHHRKVISKSLEKIHRINQNLQFSAKLVERDPANKIVEIAKEEKSDLIIVGNKNHTSIHIFFLGSVSGSVVNNSEVPVLVIK